MLVPFEGIIELVLVEEPTTTGIGAETIFGHGFVWGDTAGSQQRWVLHPGYLESAAGRTIVMRRPRHACRRNITTLTEYDARLRLDFDDFERGGLWRIGSSRLQANFQQSTIPAGWRDWALPAFPSLGPQQQVIDLRQMKVDGVDVGYVLGTHRALPDGSARSREYWLLRPRAPVPEPTVELTPAPHGAPDLGEFLKAAPAEHALTIVSLTHFPPNVRTA